LYSSQKYYGDHITEVEIGGACSACEREESVYRVLLGNMKERNHGEYLVADRSKTLNVS
jgi:predicted transcriptional regulator